MMDDIVNKARGQDKRSDIKTLLFSGLGGRLRGNWRETKLLEPLYRAILTENWCGWDTNLRMKWTFQ